MLSDCDVDCIKFNFRIWLQWWQHLTSLTFQLLSFQEKEVTITKPNGETTVTTVRVWNETVSNLTLMALGSSAPEILLSVIEVHKTFHMLLTYTLIQKPVVLNVLFTNCHKKLAFSILNDMHVLLRYLWLAVVYVDVTILKISISFSLAASMAISGDCKCIFGPHIWDPNSVLPGGHFAFIWTSSLFLYLWVCPMFKLNCLFHLSFLGLWLLHTQLSWRVSMLR